MCECYIYSRGHGRVTSKIVSGCLAGSLICVPASSCTVLLIVLVMNLPEGKRFPKTYVYSPLPIAYDRISSLIDILVALSILMGYSVTTASFVTYIVREHQTKAKQLQHISGIGVTCYWVTNFIYDMVSNFCRCERDRLNLNRSLLALHSSVICFNYSNYYCKDSELSKINWVWLIFIRWWVGKETYLRLSLISDSHSAR